MGFFANGELVYQTTNTATAGGTTTLSATSTQIQNFTGSLNQTIKLPPTTNMIVGQSYQIYNSSTGILTIQYQDGTSFVSASSVASKTSLTVTLVSSGTTNGTWSAQVGTLLSSFSGPKNYLSAYTASTASGVQNIGNGNFETGSTNGFALGTIGTLTNGLPTGTPTFGSGAAGTLSISTVSSGQLSGNYSLSYASSAATTVGNMVASSSFYIDLEDQAKVMTVKFYYKVASGSTNCNFSGTSSNSFAWAVYDVTNSVWLSSSGNFNLIQSSGTGYVTGTFQTGASTNQIAFVIYNANATTGAATLYIDDIFVGPQTAPSGPAMTDSVAYVPTVTGAGTIGTTNLFWSRRGDKLFVQGYITTGTVAASTASVSLPPGLSISTLDIPTSQNQIIGYATRNSVASANNNLNSVIASTANSTTVVYFSQYNGSGTNVGSPQNGNTVWASSEVEYINFEVPIAGWSSNSSMSSDTDTRVVAASYYATSNYTSSTSQSANFDTKIYDTHAAVTPSAAGTGTWKFTAPVTGYYRVSAFLSGAPASSSFNADLSIYKNGSSAVVIGGMSAVGTSGIPGNGTIQLNAGDYIDLRTSSSSTFGGGSLGATGASYIYIERVSGPAVVAATESIGASYYVSASTVTPGTSTQINYDTKIFDTHNAVTTGAGAWKYTAPASGIYHVTQNTSWNSSGSSGQIILYKNGSSFAYLGPQVGTSASIVTNGSIDVLLNAGDYLDMRPNNAMTINGGSAPCVSFFSIARTGRGQ